MINKKKKILIMFIFIVVGLIISFVGLFQFDKKYDEALWMSDLDDATIINEMSIPGTHNSGAMHSLFDVSGKCQDMTISNQLKIGVRFLDIRLQLVNNEFMVVHDFVGQKLKFIDVLEDIDTFIKNNNKEFIIMSLKEDADAKKSNVSFSDELYNLLLKYEHIVFDNELPKTLGDARGKVYILNRFAENEIGIPARNGWKDSTSFEIGNLYVQDNYCIDDIETKKIDIINAIEYAVNNDKLVINFTSCYLDGKFPPINAGKTALILNPWLKEVIKDYDHGLGIILMDFVTEDLAKEIYMRNDYEVRS